jgi:hypothetical protein
LEDLLTVALDLDVMVLHSSWLNASGGSSGTTTVCNREEGSKISQTEIAKRKELMTAKHRDPRLNRASGCQNR